MPLFYTPDDMQNLQNAVLSSAQATNTSISSCTSLPSATVQEWGSWYDEMQKFCEQIPVLFALPWDPSNEVLATPTRYDRLLGYQAELGAWQTRLTTEGKGCSFSPGITQAPPPVDVGSMVKYAAIAIAAVASAVVVVKVIDEVNLFAGRKAA